MGRGRPPKGLKHVEDLPGTRDSKRRLRVILETLVGERSVSGACEALGVSESRFHQLRRDALEGAMAALAGRPAGRPAAEQPDVTSMLEELRAENRDLRIDLQASRVRTEVALVAPHLLRDTKKKSRRR